MEKKTRELTEKEQMDINGGAVHTTIEDGPIGWCGDVAGSESVTSMIGKPII